MAGFDRLARRHYEKIRPGPVSGEPAAKQFQVARQLLAETNNNFTWVAAQLGINPSTLWRWRKAGKI